ncbi:MAG: hypothetical protein AAF471_09260, partial [Myxococcota bacterium]
QILFGDPEFRRNDRKSVLFFVECAFSSSSNADPSTLSSLRKQGSILERSANLSSEKQPADLFGRPLSGE